jgi:hypothetical protein
MLFMFFHFMTASLFLGFGIWTYTNWSLDTEFTRPLVLMFKMMYGIEMALN